WYCCFGRRLSNNAVRLLNKNEENIMKSIIVISLIVFLSIDSFSQDNHQYSIWGNFGGGLAFADYSNESGGGFSVNYGVSGKYDFYMVSVKRHNNMEFSFKSPQEKLNSTS